MLKMMSGKKDNIEDEFDQPDSLVFQATSDQIHSKEKFVGPTWLQC